MKRLGLVGVVGLLFVWGCSPQPKPTVALGGGIHGHVVVMLRASEQPTGIRGPVRIEIPGASVTAKNLMTGTASLAVSTNAHGYFQLPHLPPGAYQVCASAPGFTAGCYSSNVTVGSFSVVLPDDVQLQAKQPVI